VTAHLHARAVDWETFPGRCGLRRRQGRKQEVRMRRWGGMDDEKQGPLPFWLGLCLCPGCVCVCSSTHKGCVCVCHCHCHCHYHCHHHCHCHCCCLWHHHLQHRLHLHLRCIWSRRTGGRGGNIPGQRERKRERVSTSQRFTETHRDTHRERRIDTHKVTRTNTLCSSPPTSCSVCTFSPAAYHSLSSTVLQ
jgi:hypothetical protein